MDQALEGGLSLGPLSQLPELRVGPALPPLFLGGPAVLGGGVGVGGCDGVVGTGGGGGPRGFPIVLFRGGARGVGARADVDSEYVCDLEYLFSRMNGGSYRATEPHLWLMSKIPTRKWDDCHATSERKSRTNSYEDLVHLLMELALERENDSHMEKFLKKHLGRGGTPTPERGEAKGSKSPTNANQGGAKGRHSLRAMNEVKPDAGTPPMFYCKPVNDKGGPCHAPDCDHRSSCFDAWRVPAGFHSLSTLFHSRDGSDKA